MALAGLSLWVTAFSGWHLTGPCPAPGIQAPQATVLACPDAATSAAWPWGLQALGAILLVGGLTQFGFASATFIEQPRAMRVGKAILPRPMESFPARVLWVGTCTILGSFALADAATGPRAEQAIFTVLAGFALVALVVQLLHLAFWLRAQIGQRAPATSPQS